MDEAPKKKMRTSTTVKRRYNDKTYSRIIADLPKELVADFRISIAEQGVSIASVLKKALEKFVDEYPPQNRP